MRFITTRNLWLPYNLTLKRTVEHHALTDGDGLIDVEVESQLERLAEEAYVLLVNALFVVEAFRGEGVQTLAGVRLLAMGGRATRDLP